MEQRFRIVLWMFCLVGYLQARPLDSEQDIKSQGTCYKINVDDLNLNLTKEEVSCEQHVTFTSPTKVQSECYGAAMTVFIKELKLASKTCTDEWERIVDITEKLTPIAEKTKGLQPASSECQWGNKQFGEFMEDLRIFLQQLSSNNLGNC